MLTFGTVDDRAPTGRRVGQWRVLSPSVRPEPVRMRLPLRLSGPLVAGALIALVAGCAQDAAEPQSAPSSSGPAATSLLRAAASATELQGSARYLLSTATRIDDQDVVLSGEGVYDWMALKGRTTYVVPAGAVEQRLLAGTVFFVLPQQPGVFFSVPTAEVALTPLGGTVSPTAQLSALASVTEAEVVGEQEVRDVPTTHYRGSYDVPAALQRGQGVQRHALRSSLGAAVDLPEIPLEAFLDEDGLLRRLTQTVEVPASQTTNGQVLTVTTTLELYEFGLEVVVPGPPAAAIRDGAQLLAALRTVLPVPAAAPAPLPSGPAAAVPTPPAAG
ncbi:hypothetical protein BH24ACT10_BH24ACT10_18290 [soil metagenome]